jgi:hypothetical protein
VDNEIYIKVPREKISFLTRIIEGYDHLGVVSTVNSQEGLVVIRVTPDTAAGIREILDGLPFLE